jgi:hypothetical protein
VTNGDVSRNRFNYSLRTRVSKDTKKAYEKLALKRGVKEAHLQREALQRFIELEAPAVPTTTPKAK